MATFCPFFAKSTGLWLFSMEAMRPISMNSWEGIQIGVPICEVDNVRSKLKETKQIVH